MASISIVTRPAKTGRRLPLYIRLSHKGSTRYLSLGIELAKSHWNKESETVRRSHANAHKLNAHLADVRAQAESVLHDLVASDLAVTAKRLQARVRKALEGTPEEEYTFTDYCDDQIASWEGRWTYGTMLAYRTAVTKLCEMAGRVTWDEMTPALARRFNTWMLREKGNSANTRAKNIKTLSTFYRSAQKEGIAPAGLNPWSVVDVKKEAAKKEKLSTAELKIIAAADLAGRGLVEEVRDWFIFAFYAGGMRFSDVAELRRRHIETDGDAVRVKYRMGKTKDLHAVLLVPEAVEILDRYGWRGKAPDDFVFGALEGYDLSTPESRRSAISSRNAYANKMLQKIAEEEGIETHVSFHLSRHSTAGYLLEQGYDVRTIQKVLGHHSVAQTEQYLRGFQSGGPDEATSSLSL